MNFVAVIPARLDQSAFEVGIYDIAGQPMIQRLCSSESKAESSIGSDR